MISKRAVAAALLLAAACGKSKEERLFDQLAQICTQLAVEGTSFGQAQNALSGGLQDGPFCSGSLTPAGSNDFCGEISAENPVCQVFYFWLSGDPDACDNGCCVCEIRVLQANLEGQGDDAPVCAARFLRGQPCT